MQSNTGICKSVFYFLNFTDFNDEMTWGKREGGFSVISLALFFKDIGIKNLSSFNPYLFEIFNLDLCELTSTFNPKTRSVWGPTLVYTNSNMNS